MSTIDYAPLSAPVTREEARAFRRESRARSGGLLSGGIVAVIALVVGVVGGAAALLVVIALGVAVWTAPGGPDGGMVLLTLALLVVLGLTAWGIVAGTVGTLGTWSRWLRLTRFATANRMTFSASSPDPRYPGAIFTVGRDRRAVEHLRSTEGRYVDFGNYRYVTGSGKNQTTHHWGFLALKLDRRLPHMVLDARSNNGLFGATTLPTAFSRDQVLSLEGDFDRHFTLYCPAEYERDALYVFTPDLMALLIDEAAPYDVEIVDDWMFVYSPTRFPPADEATYRRLFRIVDTVGAKTVAQTGRYADDRAGVDRTANLVAPQGRRLKRGISAGAVVFIVVFVLGFVWNLVGGAFGY
ncbi:hypothetical protein CLV46_2139 [Diaminobutyricimonas aerilata]|uniref:DUF3137 domain-containing protein n=1 Tax=Diaminobutyricimonas aerilata TaxID=1162967 RepID=A0A2M9CL04_9MICO|nr:hypothetical protein [Diaminobutyricimonas aerilata]PJJ72567.1 hypothetical protein CLV46_2139 [Diaminobutyricimonas aerilata]